MNTKSNYFQGSWSVTKETTGEIQKACKILKTENESYTVRMLISLGLQKLKMDRKKK